MVKHFTGMVIYAFLVILVVAIEIGSFTTSVKEGENVIIECGIQTTEEQNLQWEVVSNGIHTDLAYNVGGSIRCNGKVIVCNLYRNGSIELINITKEDGGIYRCSRGDEDGYKYYIDHQLQVLSASPPSITLPATTSAVAVKVGSTMVSPEKLTTPVVPVLAVLVVILAVALAVSVGYIIMKYKLNKAPRSNDVELLPQHSAVPENKASSQAVPQAASSPTPIDSNESGSSKVHANTTDESKSVQPSDDPEAGNEESSVPQAASSPTPTDSNESGSSKVHANTTDESKSVQPIDYLQAGKQESSVARPASNNSSSMNTSNRGDHPEDDANEHTPLFVNVPKEEVDYNTPENNSPTICHTSTPASEKTVSLKEKLQHCSVDETDECSKEYFKEKGHKLSKTYYIRDERECEGFYLSFKCNGPDVKIELKVHEDAEAMCHFYFKDGQIYCEVQGKPPIYIDIGFPTNEAVFDLCLDRKLKELSLVIKNTNKGKEWTTMKFKQLSILLVYESDYDACEILQHDQLVPLKN